MPLAITFFLLTLITLLSILFFSLYCYYSSLNYYYSFPIALILFLLLLLFSHGVALFLWWSNLIILKTYFINKRNLLSGCENQMWKLIVVVIYIRTALFENWVSLKFIYFDNLKILVQKSENCPTLAQTQRTQRLGVSKPRMEVLCKRKNHPRQVDTMG